MMPKAIVPVQSVIITLIDWPVALQENYYCAAYSILFPKHLPVDMH